MPDEQQRFTEMLRDYTTARLGNPQSFATDDAANRLPLDKLREPARWSTTEHEHAWIAKAWAASIEDAARELHNLVVIHDNGGTASSPKKIKRAARELLRLLGED